MEYLSFIYSYSSLDTSSASDASGAGAASAPSSSSHTAAAPLRLSDMLKRKRVSNKRPSGRKGRQHSEGDLPAAATPSTSAVAGPSSPNSPGSGTSSSAAAAAAAAAAATAYDLYGSSPPSSDLALGPATPSRRSRLADRTSSLLSQLHPARWVKSSSGSNSGNAAGSSAVDGRKDGNSSAGGGLSSTAAAAALLQESVPLVCDSINVVKNPTGALERLPAVMSSYKHPISSVQTIISI